MANYKLLVKKAELEAKTKAMIERENEAGGNSISFEQGRKSGKKKSLDKAEEGEAAAGRKKKRNKKEKKRVTVQQDRSSTPSGEQARPQMTGFGVSGDMGRLTDLSFGKMSGPFHGGINTPGGDEFWCGVAGDGGMPAPGGNFSGLPPPPFASQEARMMENMENHKKEAQFAAMKEAQQLAEARMAAAGAHRGDGYAPGDIQKKFAALAEAEARHRMQMEIEGGMMGGRSSMLGNAGGGQGQQQDKIPQDAGPSGRGGPSDSFPPYDSKSSFAGQGNFTQGGSSSASGMSSSMRAQFMDRFGSDMSGAGEMPQGFRYPPPNTCATDQDQRFDMEVERFLSCLGREIKEKHRRHRMGQGGTTASASPTADGSGFGGNMGKEGMGAGMGMGSRGSKGGFPNQMMAGMPMGARAEMMAGMMMRNGASGNSNYNAADQPNPEMMAEMMRRNNVGAAANNNSGMMPRPPFDGNDFAQRRQGRGGVGGGGGGGDDDNPALPEYGWGQNGPNQR